MPREIPMPKPESPEERAARERMIIYGEIVEGKRTPPEISPKPKVMLDESLELELEMQNWDKYLNGFVTVSGLLGEEADQLRRFLDRRKLEIFQSAQSIIGISPKDRINNAIAKEVDWFLDQVMPYEERKAATSPFSPQEQAWFEEGEKGLVQDKDIPAEEAMRLDRDFFISPERLKEITKDLPALKKEQVSLSKTLVKLQNDIKNKYGVDLSLSETGISKGEKVKKFFKLAFSPKRKELRAAILNYETDNARFRELTREIDFLTALIKNQGDVKEAARDAIRW